VHVATDAVAGAFYLCVCLTVAVSGLWWLTNRLRGATTGAWVRGLFAVGLGYNLGIFATLLWILGRPADLVWLAPGLLPASCFMCVVLLFWLATRSRAENGARSLVSVRTAAASGLVVSLWLYALVGFASLPLRMAEHSRPDAQAQHRPLHD
jgi:hypothetical protein